MVSRVTLILATPVSLQPLKTSSLFNPRPTLHSFFLRLPMNRGSVSFTASCGMDFASAAVWTSSGVETEVEVEEEVVMVELDVTTEEADAGGCVAWSSQRHEPAAGGAASSSAAAARTTAWRDMPLKYLSISSTHS